jgi:hypothetical protein
MYAIPSEKRTILQKFLHNQLPCNQRNNVRMFEYKPPYCTLCDQILEDQSHVLCCPHCPVRTKIRERFKQDLLRLLVNTNTHETTIRVLTYTINTWLNMNTIPQFPELAPDGSDTLRSAYMFQHEIGWEQFFKGRLHIAWGEMHNHTQHHVSQNHPMDAETWGSKIISLMWKFVLEMWFARNETEHNLDNAGTTIKKRKLVERISWIKTKMDPKLTHPYKETTHTSLFELPPPNLEMIIDQLQTIYHKHRLNPETFDVT